MYLHNDKELFKETVEATAWHFGMDTAIVEKDYYVTMILKKLVEKTDNICFKGGTSLSKGYKVLNRFSEDIDITFTEHLGTARRKKLKYSILKTISEELSMPIPQFDSKESNKDYNYYIFQYESVFDNQNSGLSSGVKLETALGSYAFPVEEKTIDSYIRRYLEIENRELIKEYELEQFSMLLQTIERTFIDKVFALCDYYIQGKSKRCSRHLYDIYKLSEHIRFDNDFQNLIKEVRRHRAKMEICPSAKEGIDISALVYEFCNNDFYKDDYQQITEYFVNDMVNYQDAKKCLLQLIDKNMF